MEMQLQEMNKIIAKLLTLSIPSLCVINGPCVAGAVFIAMAHDKVLMLDTEKAYMYLNEALIDYVVPYRYMRILTEMTNGHTAR